MWYNIGSYKTGGYDFEKLLILCLLVFSSFSVVACGSETKSEPDAVPMKPATAVFETSMGDFEVKLATDLAPKTCENFINLAKKGFIMELPFIVLLIIL